MYEVPSCGVDFNSNKIVAGYSYKLRSTIVFVYLADKTHFRAKGLWVYSCYLPKEQTLKHIFRNNCCIGGLKRTIANHQSRGKDYCQSSKWGISLIN